MEPLRSLKGFLRRGQSRVWLSVCAALALGVGLFLLLRTRSPATVAQCRDLPPTVGARSPFSVEGATLAYSGASHVIWATQGPIRQYVQLPDDVAFLLLIAPTACSDARVQALHETLSNLHNTPTLIVPGPCDTIQWFQDYLRTNSDAAFAVATGVDRLRFLDSSIVLNPGAPRLYAQLGACVSFPESVQRDDDVAWVGWTESRAADVPTFVAWPRDVVPFFEPTGEVALDGPVPTGIIRWQVVPYQRSLFSHLEVTRIMAALQH